jgi:hypothetical protein
VVQYFVLAGSDFPDLKSGIEQVSFIINSSINKRFLMKEGGRGTRFSTHMNVSLFRTQGGSQ